VQAREAVADGYHAVKDQIVKVKKGKLPWQKEPEPAPEGGKKGWF
jgi:hypothetical protein